MAKWDTMEIAKRISEVPTSEHFNTGRISDILAPLVAAANEAEELRDLVKECSYDVKRFFDGRHRDSKEPAILSRIERALRAKEENHG